MKLTLAALAIVATPALAQVAYPPGATQTDIANAITAASPPDCTAPLSDAAVASAGTQPRCMPRPDAVRAAVIQSTQVVTASDGTFSGNWPATFPNVPTASWAQKPYTVGQNAPYDCAVLATATGFQGKCWQLVATTLPATATALLGLVISPVNVAAGGLTITVGGRL